MKKIKNLILITLSVLTILGLSLASIIGLQTKTKKQVIADSIPSSSSITTSSLSAIQNKSHPYILYEDTEVSALKEKIKSGYSKKAYEYVEKTAKKYLLDYITEDDKQRIKNYIYKNGIQKEHFCGLETYLTEWAKNKKKLFHLLNGNLRHVITGCTWKKPYSDTRNELINIMNHSDCNFVSHYEEFIWDVIQNILKQ